MKKDICPNCKKDLSYKHSDGETYSTCIGLEDSSIYDGVSWWACPECLHMWKRFEWSPDPKNNEACQTFYKSMLDRKKSNEH